MYDLLILDTQIVDGTGNPWRHGNMAVKDGRIVDVGHTLSDGASVTLDGRGLVTCPGSIDFHIHSDLSNLVNPRAESATRQGITTQDAVRKMSAAPAARLGLTDRGLLRAGLAADICIFDPRTVINRADRENTEAYPEGIETASVNGQIVIQDGKQTGALPGRVL